MVVIGDGGHCNVSERTVFISLCGSQDGRYAVL